MDQSEPQYVESLVFSDERGKLSVLIERQGFIFKNSTSNAGVFRGLHIQLPPYKQEKYIRVKKGKVLDICVDLNSASPQFGSIFYFDLQATEDFFYVPPHFAHGFFCQTDVIFEYICLGAYNEASEVVIFPPTSLAQRVGPSSWSQATLSEKDLGGITMADCLSRFSHVHWD